MKLQVHIERDEAAYFVAEVPTLGDIAPDPARLAEIPPPITRLLRRVESDDLSARMKSVRSPARFLTANYRIP